MILIDNIILYIILVYVIDEKKLILFIIFWKLNVDSLVGKM